MCKQEVEYFPTNKQLSVSFILANIYVFKLILTDSVFLSFFSPVAEKNMLGFPMHVF